MTTIDPENVADYLDKEFTKAIQDIKIEGFKEAVSSTIVDTGKLRRSWKINGKATGGGSDPQGYPNINSGQKASIEAAVRTQGKFTEGVLSNDQPYSEILDRRDGIGGRAASLVRSQGRRIAER